MTTFTGTVFSFIKGRAGSKFGDAVCYKQDIRSRIYNMTTFTGAVFSFIKGRAGSKFGDAVYNE